MKTKRKWTDGDMETVIDEFIIPLANMNIDASNQCNIVELCKNAAEWMEQGGKKRMNEEMWV